MSKNFIPTIWSARINAKNQENYVVLQDAIINRDYEGDIKDYGDTVKITSLGDITITDYTNGMLEDAEELTSDQISLVIDQAKAFHFKVDDIDAAQSNLPLVDLASARASEKLIEIAEKYITSKFTEFGNKVGSDSAPIELSKANVFDQIVDLATELDKKKVPNTNRWLLVNADVYGLLVKSGELQKATPNETILNGQVGKVSGFTVFLSHNITNGETVNRMLAGHNSGWTFAEQIVKVQSYIPEKSFATSVKGLHVYGSKVTKADNLAVLTYTITQ